MGQYHIPVNLDKREFIYPHGLGCGLKLYEQAWCGAEHPGTPQALMLLLACSNGRGGGDFPPEFNWNTGGTGLRDKVTGAHHDIRGDRLETYRTEPDKDTGVIGRWAGDRIAIVGDYGEADDLPPDLPSAEDIYGLCSDVGELPEHNKWRAEKGRPAIQESDLFRNITPLVRAAMEAVFDVRYVRPKYNADAASLDEAGWLDVEPAPKGVGVEEK